MLQAYPNLNKIDAPFGEHPDNDQTPFHPASPMGKVVCDSQVLNN